MPRRFARIARHAATALAASLIASAPAYPAEPQKPRLIVITDIGTEPDDIESMVRVLTYSNEIDIEGLIASTSRHLPNRTHRELIEERVDAYGKVLANLRVHDPRYPDAALLKSRIRSWRPLLGMAGVGKGKENEASNLIIAAVDKADARPVWVSVWGGAAPLAQALWTVQHTRKPAAVARFVSKLRVYTISDQDDAGPWARATFPHLFWISSIHGYGNYPLAAWTGMSSNLPGADPAPISRQWLRANIQRGPLGELYPMPIFAMEGDTPSFLNLIDNGLSSPEHPDWGGWGGRWEKPSAAFGLWADAIDQATGVDGKTYADNKATVWRWRSAFQNDFAARIGWTIAPKFADANHAPRLVLNGSAGSAPVTIVACPGADVALSAKGSADPDAGQQLTYRWWRYADPSGWTAPPGEVTSAGGTEAKFVAKPWVQNHEFPLPALQRFHVMLEVTDNGTPALTRYRRAVIDVATDGRMVNGRACPKIVQQPWPKEIAFATRKPADTGAAFSSNESTLGELLANPATRAVLNRNVPGLADRAANPAAQGMTLRGIKAFVPALTDEVLAEIDVELAKIPAK